MLYASTLVPDPPGLTYPYPALCFSVGPFFWALATVSQVSSNPLSSWCFQRARASCLACVPAAPAPSAELPLPTMLGFAILPLESLTLRPDPATPGPGPRCLYSVHNGVDLAGRPAVTSRLGSLGCVGARPVWAASGRWAGCGLAVFVRNSSQHTHAHTAPGGTSQRCCHHLLKAQTSAL